MLGTVLRFLEDAKLEETEVIMPRPPQDPNAPKGSAPPPERPPAHSEYDVWAERSARLVPREAAAKPQAEAQDEVEPESPEKNAEHYQKELEKYRRRSRQRRNSEP